MGIYDLSNEMVIGIDIGGTNTKYGLVNHRGQIFDKGDIKTDGYATIEEYVDALHSAIYPLIQKFEKDYQLKGIGVGAPMATTIRALLNMRLTCPGKARSKLPT